MITFPLARPDMSLSYAFSASLNLYTESTSGFTFPVEDLCQYKAGDERNSADHLQLASESLKAELDQALPQPSYVALMMRFRSKQWINTYLTFLGVPPAHRGWMAWCHANFTTDRKPWGVGPTVTKTPSGARYASLERYSEESTRPTASMMA